MWRKQSIHTVKTKFTTGKQASISVRPKEDGMQLVIAARLNSKKAKKKKADMSNVTQRAALRDFTALGSLHKRSAGACCQGVANAQGGTTVGEGSEKRMEEESDFTLVYQTSSSQGCSPTKTIGEFLFPPPGFTHVNEAQSNRGITRRQSKED